MKLYPLLLFLLACKPEPEIIPCSTLHTVTSLFTIQENHGKLVKGYNGEWEKYYSDSVMSRSVILSARESNANYLWKIGKYTFSNQVLEITFPDSIQNFPIQLVVNKTPSNNCFPEDDGIDSLTKTITFLSPSTSSFIGSFSKIGDPTQKVVISNLNSYNVNIEIIDKEKCKRTYDSELGPKLLTFTTPLGSYEPCKNLTEGFAKMIGKDTIEIMYKKGKPSSYTEYKFIGVRL